ncbi:MAG: protein kinase [Clostridiales bacterium]|nr:protein kinase [Clostridiales bacterium]
MADDCKDKDLWAQLLGAAQTEAAKEQEVTSPKEEPEDPWAQLLGAAEKHIAEQQRGDTLNAPEVPFAKGSVLLYTYRIESDPMHGGMGDIWRVHHTGWNMDLAMKRPQEKMFSSESSKQGFIDECQNWINLGLHPNIVSCYYVREIDGVPTIFSEWMENGDLENHIRNGTLYDGNEEEIQKRLLDIAIQYARGLHYAHDAGLIHQDVKPANLLLTNDWQAKAADFGLANARAQLTVLEGDVTEQDPGQSLNAAAGGYTPAYCSMEQMDGKTLTRRTDIYSWAVSVMEMYYGSRPWTNGPVAGMNCRDYMEDQESRMTIPQKLQGLLAKCMALEEDDRPHDFGIVEDELKIIWRESFGEDYPRPEPEAAPDTADSLNNRALTFLDLDLREIAERLWTQALEKEPDHLASVYNLGLYRWRRGLFRLENLMRQCSELLAASRGPVQEKTACRILEQIKAEKEDTDPCANILCVRREIDNFEPSHHSPAACFSPDGRILYTLNDTLAAYRTDSMEEIWCRPEAVGDTLATDLTVTPDGKHLLFRRKRSTRMRNGKEIVVNPGEDRKLWVAEATTGKVLRDLDVGYGNNSTYCLHPDSARCFVCDGEKVTVWDLTSGKRVNQYAVPGEKREIPQTTVSPDGKTLCILGTVRGEQCLMFLLDASSGHLLRMAEFEEDFCFTPVFMPDGKEIYTSYQSGIVIWDADTLRYRTVDTIQTPDKMWISPDGTRLLTTDMDFNIRLWETKDFRLLRSFQGTHEYILSMDAAPDLSRIAVADWSDHVLVWDAASPVRSALWEVSRIRDYSAVVDLRQAENRMTEKIRARIDSGRIDEALELLLRAEGEYGRHTFFPLRRDIARYCTRKGLTGKYEIGSFSAGSWSAQENMTAFHPVNGTISAFGQHARIAWIYDESGKMIRMADIPGLKEFDDGLHASCYSPEGEYLAFAGDHAVMMLDPESNIVFKILKGPEGKFRHLEFSPDGQLLAACGIGKYSYVWSVKTQTPVMKIRNPDSWGGITAIRFIRDGKQLVTLSEGGMDVFSIPKAIWKEAEEQARPDHIYRMTVKCADCAVSRDGKQLFLFTADPERRVYVRDTESWAFTGSYPLTREGKGYIQHPRIYPFSVSPDDALLATAEDRTVIIWSMEDGRELESFDMAEAVKELRFSPDGNVLLAISGEEAHCWAIRREMVFPGWKEREEAAEPVIERFLESFPHPREAQRQLLLRELGNKGFGFIRKESVLSRMGEPEDDPEPPGPIVGEDIPY